MIDLIDDNDVRDPYLTPMEWAKEFLDGPPKTKCDLNCEDGWLPQIDGTWIACPGCGEG